LNKFLIAAILWAGLILVLTLTPGASVPDYRIFTFDTLGHFGIFLVLAYLLASGLHVKSPFTINRSIVIGLLYTIVYGALIEIAQEYIPQRGMEWSDLLANCSGSILGITLFYISIKKNWQ
jgi:VanZ family protein